MINDILSRCNSHSNSRNENWTIFIPQKWKCKDEDHSKEIAGGKTERHKDCSKKNCENEDSSIKLYARPQEQKRLHWSPHTSPVERTSKVLGIIVNECPRPGRVKVRGKPLTPNMCGPSLMQKETLPSQQHTKSISFFSNTLFSQDSQ